ncbi:hypothetical protein EJ03DRAFT_328446 [Teratosphaeria nubilosa]|uniref:Uncharacterized protein n=1 Tax=Teratosphaeria nubilosa TaxID=161662 RepID=A0A6G1L5P1_9PEZI|nr:hypothetical protein EJ03DRAFT_328446 [Teratosphaeria nubilosa]
MPLASPRLSNPLISETWMRTQTTAADQPSPPSTQTPTIPQTTRPKNQTTSQTWTGPPTQRSSNSD